jgi:hypothetical protein
VGCEVFIGQVWEARDLVLGWDVGGKGLQGRVCALEGPVEDIGEEVGAGYGGYEISGCFEVRRAPCSSPFEVFRV